MAFQAEQKIKADILRSLSTEQLFRLLSDSDLNVLMKTLGLLRNLLSTRPVSNAPGFSIAQHLCVSTMLFIQRSKFTYGSVTCTSALETATTTACMVDLPPTPWC